MSASFQQRAAMVVNPNATGDGKKNNPGIGVDHTTKDGVDKR